MSVKKRFTDDSYRKEPWFRALVSALLSCRSEQEMMDFVRDIGALSELQAWSERFEVARQLAKGLSYRQVAALTGASTTTVTRVAKCIENGEGGLRKILNVHRHHRMKADPLRRDDDQASARAAIIEQAKDRAVGQSLAETPREAPPPGPGPDALLRKYLQK